MRQHLRCILFCFTPLCAWASLEWETTELRLPAVSDQREMVGVYKFTNTGTETVTIERTLSSCGCTVPELEKKTYAPGESGELKAIFTIGGRTGPQHKVLTVITDEVSAKPIRLVLETNIPEVADIRPKMLLWRKGDTQDWKDVTVVTDPANQVRVAQGVDNLLPPHQFLPVEDKPGHYLLRLQPSSTENRSQFQFPLRVKLATGEEKPYTVYMLVR